jgi:hypothetical protein
MATRADRRWAALERHRRNGRRRGALVVLLALASLALVVVGAVLSGCELDPCHPVRLECRPPAPPPFPDGATHAHWSAPTVPDGGAWHVHPADGGA